jgi:uncharacterized protein YbjT (DUF2867 family)
MSTPVVSNEKYVILGATGHTGSIVADVLLSKGQKVRVIGRDKGRLQRFVDKGAEAFTADMSDTAALTKAFTGARAAYLLLPPAKSPEEQERDSDAVAKAVKESGLRYAVHLSSYGAQVAKGAGPVSGLHSSEEKLNAISSLNVLHVRAAYFMENNLAAIGMIHHMGIFGNALLPDLRPGGLGSSSACRARTEQLGVWRPATQLPTRCAAAHSPCAAVPASPVGAASRPLTALPVSGLGRAPAGYDPTPT